MILELSLTPVETYDRLAKIVDQANSIMSSLYLSSKMKETEHNLDLKLDRDEERAHFFRPAMSSNVIFCSAIDGFGFTVRSIARQFWRSERKFGFAKIAQLERVLWSDKFRISDDRTKIVKRNGNSSKPNLFITHCLRPLWRLYHAAMKHCSSERLEKALVPIATTTNTTNLSSKDKKSIDSPSKEAQQQQIRRLVIRRLVSQWLPLHTATLGMVVDVMPNPREAMKSRSRILFSGGHEDDRIVKSVSTCDRSEDAPVVVFVTKLIEVDSKSLSDYKDENNMTTTTLLGFARVFSGVLKRTTKLYLNGGKPLPSQIQLYLMMGNRQFREVNTVSAGSVVAIRHLDRCVDKFATLISEQTSCNMSKMRFRTKPIVRVAIEPKHAHNLKELENAIQRVSASDPCVEYEINRDTGEIVLATLGELHLEQCMERLRRRVSGEITVSEPLTMFKETCKKMRGEVVNVLTSNKRFRVVMSCGRLDELKKIGDLVPGPSTAPSTRLVIEKSSDNLLKTFRASIVSGFHLAATHGPLCHEPMNNVQFVIHSVEENIDTEKSSKEEMDEYVIVHILL